MSIQASEVCFFLKMPPEIRLCIYRELLLAGPYLEMSPQSLLAPLEEAYIPSIHPKVLADLQEFIIKDQRKYLATKRHPAILRVNHQIYNEASSMMYAEGKLMLKPGAIFCLARDPERLMFGEASKHNPWRHNPLLGIGSKSGYKTKELPGEMEPHVFARFQNVFFWADFVEDGTNFFEFLIDDDTQRLDPEDAEIFDQELRKSLFVKNFVKILSKSPKVKRLEVELDLYISLESDAMLAQESAWDGEEVEDAIIEIAKATEQAGYAQGIEIMMDSKLFKPLTELTNVEHFEFRFTKGKPKDPRKDPLPRHIKLVEQMKQTIEKNYRDPAKSRYQTRSRTGF